MSVEKNESSRPNNLGEYIPEDDNSLSRDLCVKWQSIKPLLETKYVLNTFTITPVTAAKYRGDLLGLFRHEVGVDINYIYPHIIANGYDGPNCYDGEQLTFKLLDLAALSKYYRVFTRES